MNPSAIFDAMNAASEAMHRAVKIKQLRREIAAIGTTCGGCQHWIASRTCPRERNIGGMSRGPSSGDLVNGCSKFKLKPSKEEWREKLQEELARAEGCGNG